MLNCPQHSNLQLTPRKRSTTRQLLDIARSLAVPRQDGGKLVLFETSYGVRRCLEPSLRCFLPRCFFSPYKFPIQKTGALEAMGASRTCGLGGARAHLTRAGRLYLPYRTLCACQVGAPPPPDHRFVGPHVGLDHTLANFHDITAVTTHPPGPRRTHTYSRGLSGWMG